MKRLELSDEVFNRAAKAWKLSSVSCDMFDKFVKKKSDIFLPL